MRILTVALLALALAGCAAAGPAQYGAAEGGRFGYEETRIEQDRYRIVYRGSGGMAPEMVEDYALRRAAELTVSAGYDWFRVVARNMTRERRGGVGVGAGVGTGSYGRSSGVSVGVGGDFGRVGARDYFTARIEVLFGAGAAPGDADVYEASSWLERSEGAAGSAQP
jgi:hypothetical protein